MVEGLAMSPNQLARVVLDVLGKGQGVSTRLVETACAIRGVDQKFVEPILLGLQMAPTGYSLWAKHVLEEFEAPRCADRRRVRL